MPYCTVEWWNELTEMCDQAIEAATGEPPRPWPFKWELNDQDSATVVAAILNPPEPNQALKDAAGRHQAMSKEGPMTDRTIRIRITGPFSDGDLAEIIATLRRLDSDQKFVVTITDADGSLDAGERLIRELLPPLPERTTAFARAAYRDASFPARLCDHCATPYNGPSVYCSLECAVADA
jgi:hypothetical protein